jgi:hypothetical protein
MIIPLELEIADVSERYTRWHILCEYSVNAAAIVSQYNTVRVGGSRRLLFLDFKTARREPARVLR